MAADPAWDSPDGSARDCAADFKKDVTDINQIVPAAASGFLRNRLRL